LRDISDVSGLREDGGNLEHCSGSLAIGCCDERCLDVKEAVVLEKLMGCEGHVVLDSGHGRDDLGPGSKMGNVSQGFQVDVLAVERVLVIVTAAKDNGFFERFAAEFHLDGLTFSRRFDDFPGESEGIVFLCLFEVFPVGNGVLDDNLKGYVVGSINKFDEQQCVFGLQSGFSCPADYSNDLIDIVLPISQKVSQSEGASHKIGGLMFFVELFGYFIGVGSVESVFCTFDLVREWEIDFHRDNVDLPDEIFGFQ
jgi:hypothetical protein